MKPRDQHSLIDEITYLTTLVSRPQEIAPIVTTLREIAARQVAGRPLDSADKVTLLKLRMRLAEYLVHEEKLRAFTHADLQQRVFERFEGQRRVRLLRWLTAAVVAASVLIMFGPGLLFSGATAGMLEQQTLWSPVALYGAPAVLFLLALRDFSPTLRRAYAGVCAGILLLGVAAIHEVMLDAYFVDSPWTVAGGEMLGYAAAFFVIYLGLRRHAVLLEAKRRYTGIFVLIGLSAVTWLTVALTAGQVLHSAVTNFQSAATALAAVIVGLAALEAYRIWQSSSALYGRATRWLFFSLAVHFYAVVQYLAAQFIFRDIESDWMVATLGIPYILAAALLFVAGYTFNKVGRY